MGASRRPFFCALDTYTTRSPEPIEDNFLTPEKSEIRHLDLAGTSRCLRRRCYQYAQRKKCERSGSKTEHCDSCDSSQREAKPSQTGRCKKNYTDVKKITPAIICFSDMSEIRRKNATGREAKRKSLFLFGFFLPENPGRPPGSSDKSGVRNPKDRFRRRDENIFSIFCNLSQTPRFRAGSKAIEMRSKTD